jgi:hypothetical protein
MRANRGSWHVISPASGSRGGMVAHRGVLHPDEYVNEASLLCEAEDRFGFTLLDVRGVYRQGPKSAATLARRAQIDARLLELAEAGGNMAALARIFEMDPDVFGRATARAQQLRKETP